MLAELGIELPCRVVGQTPSLPFGGAESESDQNCRSNMTPAAAEEFTMEKARQKSAGLKEKVHPPLSSHCAPMTMMMIMVSIT